MGESNNREKGAALVTVLGLLMFMTLMGFATFQSTISEIQIGKQQQSWMQAQYVAESGVALVREWFQDPDLLPAVGSFPAGFPVTDRVDFFRKRSSNYLGEFSFFDDLDRSQYIGTTLKPDFFYQGNSEKQTLLGDLITDLGYQITIKVFRPINPGAICTVEVGVKMHSGSKRTISVQMSPSPLPGTIAAIQLGRGRDYPIPLLVHWGDVKSLGDADLGPSIARIPKKDPFVHPNGSPYGTLGRRDPWVDFYVGDRVVRPVSVGCSFCEQPFQSIGYDNIHQLQTHFHSDFRLGDWDVLHLKNLAKEQGYYFQTDPDGFLYLNGIRDSNHQRTVSEVLSSRSVGDHLGFILIDTIDGKPPMAQNMIEMDLPVDYLEGYFFILADVTLQRNGSGRTLRVRTPPTEGTDDPSTRQAVILSGIHIKGILSVYGKLGVEGNPRVFGGLISQGGIIGPDEPEVWYDADLAMGYYPGLPVAQIMKGSWSIR